jgi:hypothetical protein
VRWSRCRRREAGRGDERVGRWQQRRSGRPGWQDRVFGGTGNDELYGHTGDDLLDGRVGYDEGKGGPGSDICRRIEERYSC